MSEFLCRAQVGNLKCDNQCSTCKIVENSQPKPTLTIEQLAEKIAKLETDILRLQTELNNISKNYLSF